MKRVREIIVVIASILYLIIILLKLAVPNFNISKNIQIALLFIVWLNFPIEEWIRYKKTRKKIHIVIPIATIFLIIYATFNLIYLPLMN